jgi:hypothetical protein
MKKQRDLFHKNHSHALELHVTYENGKTRILHFPFKLLDISSLQNAVNANLIDSDFKRILFIAGKP